MPDNNIFYVPNEQKSLLDNVKNLLKFIPYSEKNTEDGTTFTIDFSSSEEKLEFFATIKRNYPELLG